MFKKGQTKGFTIVEVTLFLAITTLVLVGLMTGVSSSINRQRQHDAVNDLVDFLRRAYSETTNPQNSRAGTISRSTCSVSSRKIINNTSQPGRTECAIYGKLLSFTADPDDKDDPSRIYSYDLIGNVYTDKLIQGTGEISTDYVQSALKIVGADIVAKENEEIIPAGNLTEYKPQWSARVERQGHGHELFAGLILIARSPFSGTINTFIYQGDKNINKVGEIMSDDIAKNSFLQPFFAQNESEESDPDKFSSKSAIICVSLDNIFAGHRRAIRIRAGKEAHNTSVIELLAADSQESREACP